MGRDFSDVNGYKKATGGNLPHIVNFCNFGITWGGAKRVTAVQEMLVENPKFARNFTGMEVEVVMGAMCMS